jgi:hypothetical protein
MATATERSMQARVAGLTRWAKEPDRRAATAPARQGFHARFEKQLDEWGITDPAERAIRGAQLKRAYMTSLSLKSAQARRRRAA